MNPGKMDKLRGENPSPASYAYKNMGCGTETKKFSFRRRTINHLGKSILKFPLYGRLKLIICLLLEPEY